MTPPSAGRAARAARAGREIVGAKPCPCHLRDLEPQRRVGERQECVLKIRLIDHHHNADGHPANLVGDPVRQIPALVAVDHAAIGPPPAACPWFRRRPPPGMGRPAWPPPEVRRRPVGPATGKPAVGRDRPAGPSTRPASRRSDRPRARHRRPAAGSFMNAGGASGRSSPRAAVGLPQHQRVDPLERHGAGVEHLLDADDLRRGLAHRAGCARRAGRSGGRWPARLGRPCPSSSPPFRAGTRRRFGTASAARLVRV